MFRTRGRSELVAAADAAELVDAAVGVLYGLLERSAGVLSEVEYADSLREFETVVVPVRLLRTRFDALVDAGGEDREAFMQVAGELMARLPSLSAAAETLREYADAQQLCARTSGELLAEVSRIESERGSEDPRWRDLAAWGRDQVAAAAAQAEVRNWLAAHRILTHARTMVAQAGDQVAAQASDRGLRRSRVNALAATGTALRAQGAVAVKAFERLSADSPADAAPYRASLVGAGAVFQEISSAVAAWNENIDDDSFDLDDLESRAEDAKSDLTRFVAYASEVQS